MRLSTFFKKTACVNCQKHCFFRFLIRLHKCVIHRLPIKVAAFVYQDKGGYFVLFE